MYDNYIHFPVWNKQPLTTEWQKNTRTQPTNPSETGRGVCCGVNDLFIVDIDPRHEGKVENLRPYVSQESLDAACVVLTPGGGYHLYYQHPGGKQRKSIKAIPGVEFLNNGCYAVLPGSKRVDEQGKIIGEYSFLNDDSKLKFIDKDFPFPPDKLIDLLEQKEQPVVAQASLTDSPQCSKEDFTMLLAHLEQMFPALTEGDKENKTSFSGRNDAAFRLTCFLNDFVDIPPSIKSQLILKWNSANNPPLPEPELRQAIFSGSKYRSNPPGFRTVAEFLRGGKKKEEKKTAKKKKKTAKDDSPISQPVILAELFAKQHHIECWNEQLYLYKANKWLPYDDRGLKSFIHFWLCENYPTEKSKIKQFHIKELESSIRNIVRDGESSEKDALKVLNNYTSFRNGILDHESGCILPHSHEFFTPFQLDFDFDKEAPPPTRFLQFLDESFEYKSEVECVINYLGYTLFGGTGAQKYLYLQGPPGTGKGTLINIFESLFPRSLVVGTNFHSLGSTFGLEPLVGKRLAVIADLEKPHGRELRAALEIFKNIIGEDTIPINRKNKLILTDRKLPVRFVVASNELLKVKDSLGALIRRTLLVRMRNKPSKPNPNLLKEIISERSGIARIAYERYRQSPTLIQPQENACMVELLHENDPIEFLIRENFQKLEKKRGSPDRMTASDFYRVFELLWNRNNKNIKVPSQREVTAKIRESDILEYAKISNVYNFFTLPNDPSILNDIELLIN